MVYEYNCTTCDISVEVTKPMEDHRRIEICHSCGGQMVSIVTGGRGFSYKKNEWPEYNPAFGRVVKNSSERKNLAREKGLIEVGSEDIIKLGDKMDKDKKDKADKEWSDI